MSFSQRLVRSLVLSDIPLRGRRRLSGLGAGRLASVSESVLRPLFVAADEVAWAGIHGSTVRLTAASRPAVAGLPAEYAHRSVGVEQGAAGFALEAGRVADGANLAVMARAGLVAAMSAEHCSMRWCPLTGRSSARWTASATSRTSTNWPKELVIP
jgi:hypothetical protein